MLKRGQVSIFLVMGIVVLLLAAGFFLIFSKIKTEPLKAEAEQSINSQGVRGSLQLYVENCIEETISPAIYLLAIQGGIIYPDQDSQILLTDYGLVNYGWINGINGISKEKMEEDLAHYLQENLPFCLENFNSFQQENILIISDYQKLQAEVSIGKTLLSTKLDFPIKVILPNQDEIEIDSFSNTVESNLGSLVDVIENLPYPSLHPETLMGLPYSTSVFPYDSSVMIYSLQAIETADSSQPLHFVIAVRDDFPENKAPVLDYLADQTLTVGEHWETILSAEDPNHDLLTFSSDSTFFSVTEEGVISVDLQSVGLFKVTFSVTDNRGEKDQQEVEIAVLEKKT